MRLSILIKTYNEEEKIGKCLDSVRKAIRGIEGGVEIIVADSLSSDRTVNIAEQYGAQVVQLRDARDRGCGAGVQLGFQHASGRFCYLLDGDMELQRDFLHQALDLLERDDRIAGVAGLLEDTAIRNWFDRRRLQNKPDAVFKDMEWLNGGGLYRRCAIEGSGGYAGNRNLQAFEEAELGLRLRSRGWRLVQLPVVAVTHTGHAESTSSLIRRQWRNGRVDATGILLKSSWRKPWFARVVRLFIHPIAVSLYWAAWLLVLLLHPNIWFAASLTAAGLFVFLAMVFKKRSVVDACFSIMLWHLSALGIVRGFMQRLQSPVDAIPSLVLSKKPQDRPVKLRKLQ